VNPDSDRPDASPKTEVPASSSEQTGSPPGESAPASPELTKEEQWALFEKELKESDWGHQPC
jgi:hypothetical protein